MHPPRLTRSHAYCALDLTVIICTCAPISKAPKCKTLSVSAMVVDLSNHCKWSEEFDTFVIPITKANGFISSFLTKRRVVLSKIVRK